jgi:hypothetical protein
MWRKTGLLLALIAMAPNEKLQGRWDLTLETPSGPAPSWLEIEHSGRDALVGRFVGVVGSARPISRIVADGDSLHFELPRQWESGSGTLIVDGRLDGERLSGRMVFPDGKTAQWAGTRAPLLHPAASPHWNAPIRLLHEKDLGGWHAVGGTINQWVVEDGVLRSPHSGVNIATDRTFGDFKLHIEFRFPPESNSGVYLRGRYEVQITDDFGTEPDRHRFAAIYGFIEPNEMAARRAGEWQTYDVTLVGRRVTIVANGRTVICDRDIPGITGGALDSTEGAPGPILLQGDHGPIEFRNITIATGQ